MPDITCVRCGLTREPQPFPPFPTPLGQRLFQDICATCWAEWLKFQQQLINHYGLNVREPDARRFLLQHMEQFLATSTPPA